MSNTPYSTDDLRNDFLDRLPKLAGFFTDVSKLRSFIVIAEIAISSDLLKQSAKKMDKAKTLKGMINVLTAYDAKEEKAASFVRNVFWPTVYKIYAGNGEDTDREIILQRLSDYLKIMSSLSVIRS